MHQSMSREADAHQVSLIFALGNERETGSELMGCPTFVRMND